MALPHRSVIIAAVIALFAMVAACGSGDDSSTPRTKGPTHATLSVADARTSATALNEVGFAVHRELVESGNNTVTSPLSLGGLLGLLAAGAEGKPAQDLTGRLGLKGSDDPTIGALLSQLGTSKGVTLDIANSLWTNDGVKANDKYSSFVKEVYDAQIESVPLGKNEGAERIDNWVKKATNGKIERMSEALGLPNPDAVIVLLNAVYFKGTWTTEFDPADTRPGDFELASGSKVKVPMMSLPDNAKSIETADGGSFSLLRLPYGKDKRYGMEILLPNDVVDIAGFMKTLSLDDWSKARAALHESKTPVSLPKFTSKVDSRLDHALKAAGLGSIYDSGAMSGMTDSGGTLSTVAQSVYIDVDERGTEAAAVTGGAVVTSAPMPFTVDRPFVFAITDRDTGAMLFLGSINDPTAAS